MKHASILVLVGGAADSPDLEPILQSAAADQTHLSLLILETLQGPPVYGVGYYGMPVIAESWQKDLEAAKATLQKASKTLEKRLVDAGAPGDVEILGCYPADLPSIIGKRSATCDAVVISSDVREQDYTFRNAIHGALFHSPVATILNAGSSSKALTPARVFVAWDTSLPAARAVHAALPLLKAAEEVTIAVFDPVASKDQDGENPGSDVARWLSHHGCHVNLQQYPSGGQEIGECIHKRSAETGAHLVVMGAYGHSRMRQTVFGGTTRSVVDQTDFAVLLAH